MSWVIEAIGGGSIFALLAALAKVSTQHIRRRRELSSYLKAVISSADPDSGSLISPLFNSYDKRSYVRPSLTLDSNASDQPFDARAFLLEKCFEHQSRRIVLHGTFGAGKSSIICDLAFHLAKEKLRESTRDGNQVRIPFCVPLRESDFQTEADLHAALTQLMAKYGLTSFGTFHAFLQRNAVALLLDGFDQVSMSPDPYRRAELFGMLISYIDAAKADTTIILTMRSDYFEESTALRRAIGGEFQPQPDGFRRQQPNFQLLRVEGFNDQQVEELLDGFFARNPSLNPEGISAKDALTVLKSNIHMKGWMRHPLLLIMILSQGMKNHAWESDLNLASVYQQYTSYWFLNDIQFSGFDSEDDKVGFVSDLAVSALRLGASSVHNSKIVDVGGAQRWARQCDQMLSVSLSTFSKLNGRTFLLVNRDRSIMFVHRSIQEYFCAITVLSLFRGGHVPSTELLPKFYTNLIIIFMRDMVSEVDYRWAMSFIKSPDTFLRKFSLALLPRIAISAGRIAEVCQLLEQAKSNELDLDARRHIVYGLGWLGRNPCDRELLTYMRTNVERWVQAALQYYHSRESQREHCLHRLLTYQNGHLETFGSRGLYLFDLGEVGHREDAYLIAPFTDEIHESDSVVREIALEALAKLQLLQN